MKTFTVTATVYDGNKKAGVFDYKDALVMIKWRLFARRLTKPERALVATAVGFYAICTLGREV